MYFHYYFHLIINILKIKYFYSQDIKTIFILLILIISFNFNHTNILLNYFLLNIILVFEL